jgi:hypothetical protein
MTDRTWIGGGNNKASRPNHWSPNGIPQPGDNLVLPGGSTINIAGNDLHGDPLAISSAGAVTLNLSHHAQASLRAPGPGFGGKPVATVNVVGNDTLDVTGSSDLTINLADHAKLSGSFGLSFGSTMTILGGEHAKYVNNGADTLFGAHVQVNADVVGSGTFSLSPTLFASPHSLVGSSLEFGRFVSRGQIVNVAGGTAPAVPFVSAISSLRIDHPSEFHGTIDLHDLSLADLVGLAKADSWGYKNDMLSIFNGCGRLVDKIPVISDASVPVGSAHGLSVSMSAAGDVLVKPGSDFHGVIALPTS